ncbi:MAG: cyclase family protein, partial [Alphaproteobacteria bacterium]|nr:cyclase family protein [Alphaproteobacteria bacterium]
IYLQYSTQWDSFAHMGSRFDADGDGVAELVFYNGYRAGEHVVGPIDYSDGHEHPHPGPFGAHRLGIEHMAKAGVQGRAVLIDLQAEVGRDRVWFKYADLAEVMRKQRVEIEKGDMVLIHTGWAQAVLEENKHPTEKTLHEVCAVLDGRDPALRQWVSESGLSILVGDNYAVEGFPAGPETGRGPALPLHELCLFKLGIHLGEIWHLTPLAEYLRGKGRNRFLLTAPPLRLPGAVGSPATPIATV